MINVFIPIESRDLSEAKSLFEKGFVTGFMEALTIAEINQGLLKIVSEMAAWCESEESIENNRTEHGARLLQEIFRRQYYR